PRERRDRPCAHAQSHKSSLPYHFPFIIRGTPVARVSGSGLVSSDSIRIGVRHFNHSFSASSCSLKCAPSSAAVASCLPSGVAKATPPVKIDSSDVLFTCAPSRFTFSETPPAFQKRVVVRTRFT